LTDMATASVPIALDGPLTIRTIADVRAALLEALAGHPAVQLDCTGAESVDLSFIQVVLAARLSAAQAGRQLALAAPADGALRAALEQGGLAADPFWSGGA